MSRELRKRYDQIIQNEKDYEKISVLEDFQALTAVKAFVNDKDLQSCS